MDQISLKSTLCGLVIGTLVLCSNFQFGLQTGWVSMMSMPAALLGFSWFKVLRTGLTTQENVYIQSVAVAVGTGPLSFGMVGAIPAIQSIISEEEGCKVFTIPELIFWSLGIAFTGVFTAVLFAEKIMNDPQLKFPSGSTAAALIGLLHKKPLKEIDEHLYQRAASHPDCNEFPDDEESSGGIQAASGVAPNEPETVTSNSLHLSSSTNTNAASSSPVIEDHCGDENLTMPPSYKKNIITLIVMFIISSIYTLLSRILRVLKEIPIFGHTASTYMWLFEPSPAYIGQGIIMGLETTVTMTLGTILGWAVLAPLAKFKEWAPGPIDDWSNGAQGWIMWVSLAIMVGDTSVSFAVLIYETVLDLTRRHMGNHRIQSSGEQLPLSDVQPLSDNIDIDLLPTTVFESVEDQQKLAYWGLGISSLLCILCVKCLFRDTPVLAITCAVIVSPFFSLLGVRALGETDLNPVSSIAKLTQFIFGIFMRSKRHAVLLNIVAGAITEAGAQQAGDLMQDYKTGKLLGALMTNQTIGMIIGTVWSVVASGCIYTLYNSHFPIPGPNYRIPTAYIWADCARLMTGQGLPPRAGIFALIFGIIFVILAIIKKVKSESSWSKWIPSGVAVGIGMYNVPSFTLARLVGGIISYLFQKLNKSSSDRVFMVILSSGLILGEGIMSVVWLFISL